MFTFSVKSKETEKPQADWGGTGDLRFLSHHRYWMMEFGFKALLFHMAPFTWFG